MKNFLTFVTLLLVVVVLGQEITVKGKLRDNGNQPISFATVTFEGISEGTTSFLEVSSDERGVFEAKIKKGEYLMIFQPFSGGIEEREEKFLKDTDLDVVVLDNSVKLADVVAKGEKPLYRLELDKRVYDMERDPTVRGASLSDALNNVPSVQVDGEGTVSVRGNENIRVLINGKPSAMTGVSNVGDALRNIQASQVERVEVITNPSARYDAEGTGGIINIILKRGTKQGFNASLSVDIGTPDFYAFNTNLNYKTKKWNFFVNPYIRYKKADGERNFENNVYVAQAPDTVSYQNGTRTKGGLRAGGNIGFERYIGKKNTLSASMNMRRSTGDNENKTFNTVFADNRLTINGITTEAEDETDKDIEGNLGFKHEFDKKGHALDIQANGSWATEDELSNITNIYSLGDKEDLFSRSANYEQQRRWLLQADYVLPYKENARFEFGYKGEFLTTITNFSVDSLSNGQWLSRVGFGDKVDYGQDINAVYSQYGNKYGKFSYLLGLRMEHSAISIQSREANSFNKKSYTNWFPSVTLNYMFNEDEKNQLQLSYSKRIRRPWSRFLSPFMTLSDDTNRFQGNPDLDPVTSQSYEIAFITQVGKTTFTPSAYYQRSKDYRTMYRKRVGNYFITQPINTDGHESRMGLELVSSTQLMSWWRLFGNLNFFQYDATGTYFDRDLDKTIDFSGDGFSWRAKLSSSITLPSKIDFRTNFNYRGKQKNAQSHRNAVWAVDIALSKDILKGRGTLSFNVRDLFNTRRMKVHNFGQGYDSYIDMQWRPRQFMLNFTYRINQKKKRQGGGNSRGESGEGMEM